MEIFLDQEIVYTGENTRLEITVRYSERVQEDILLINDLGVEIGSIRNDGSGEGETVVRFTETEPRKAYIEGVCGEMRSEPVYYRVQPKVTRAMTRTLSDVCKDLIAALNAANITDADSEEAKALVRDFLQKDARVASYGDNNGVILFHTTDGLLGFYGFHAKDTLEFSAAQEFITAQEAFDDYLGNTLKDGSLVQSEIPLTNSNVLFLAPQRDDPVIDWGRSVFDPRLRTLATEMSFSYKNISGSSAVDAIFAGEFNDCGLLVFMAHGGQLLTSDGFMLTMNLGKVSEYQAEKVADLLWEKAASHMYTDKNEYTSNKAEMAHLYYINSENACVLYGVSQNGEMSFEEDMVITRNLLDHVLEDKLFDNTVAYFVVCHAASDAGLRDMLFDHGASAFISTVDPLDGFVSMCALEALCDMAREASENTWTALSDAINSLQATPDDETVRAFHQSLAALDMLEDRQKNYETFAQETIAAYENEQMYNTLNLHLRTSDCGERVWHGEDVLRGRVVDQEEQPVAEADVFFYRWIDHTFRQEAQDVTVKTDADGYYEIENLPYGWYGVKAKKNGAQGDATVKVDGKKDKIDDIHLVCNDVIVTTTCVKMEDDRISSSIIVPTVYVKGNAKGSDGINDYLKEMHARALRARDNLRTQQLTNPDSRHSYDLTLKNVYASGVLLFITVEEYQYSSGAARGMRFETALAFNIKSGQLAEAKDLLPQDSDGKNALIELLTTEFEKNYGKDLFSTPREVASKAANGSICTWEISLEGMTVIFRSGDIAPAFRGNPRVTLPLSALSGILDDQYMPAEVAASGEVVLLQDAPNVDYGEKDGAVLVSRGDAANVTASIYYGDVSWAYPQTVIFYASALNNEAAYLPQYWEDTQYHVSYESNGQTNTFFNK